MYWLSDIKILHWQHSIAQTVRLNIWPTLMTKVDAWFKSDLLGRTRPSADRPFVPLFMWTTDQNLGSDRLNHGQIRTLNTGLKDYNFEVDEWTDFDVGPSTLWTDLDYGPR